MNDYITIGQIVRAIGIKGEIKVKPITDNIARFKLLKIIYINSKPHKIERCRIDKDFVCLKIGGIDDRNSAEALKDAFIEIDRVNAVPLEDGSYFIADIIGCNLLDDCGEKLGKITDISQYGAADVFTVFDGKRTARFPF